MGVAFFDQVLDDEKKKKEEKAEEERKKREVKAPYVECGCGPHMGRGRAANRRNRARLPPPTLFSHPHPPTCPPIPRPDHIRTSVFGERIPYKTRAERAAERAANGETVDTTAASASSSTPATPFAKTPSSGGLLYTSPGAASGTYATRFTARNSNATAQVTGGPRPSVSYLNKAPLPAGRPGFAGTTLAKAQAEKEAKRLEAQRNIERIAAERYQEERKRREEERLKKEAERKAQMEAEASAFSAEPEWKRNIRSGRK